VNSDDRLHLSDPNINLCSHTVKDSEQYRQDYDADYLMFVSADYDPDKPDIVAYSSYCARDTEHNGRPIVGLVFFNL